MQEISLSLLAEGPSSIFVNNVGGMEFTISPAKPLQLHKTLRVPRDFFLLFILNCFLETSTKWF